MTNNTVHISRIGNTNIISEDELFQYVYKSLPLKFRLNRNINASILKKSCINRELIFHPFWIAKTLVIAERPPFEPKKIPNMIFVDAISGYRGIFSEVPAIQKMKVERSQIKSSFIKNEEEVKIYIRDVQVRQINRSYILKKPLHEIRELFLAYLPIWKVQISSNLVNDTIYINGNTGESEKYLADRWVGRKDLIKQKAGV